MFGAAYVCGTAYRGCTGGGVCGVVYVVATVYGMEPPYGARAVLDLSRFASCCNMAEIAALNSDMMPLLC